MAQADWAHFGEVSIGRAVRRLSAFVLTLCYSRALWLELFFDQCLENFLLGHVHAFHNWDGAPRTLQTDNLRSVVLERYGDAITSTPASWNSPRTTTSPRVRAALPEEMKKGASNGPSSMYVKISSPRAPSPPSPILTARLSEWRDQVAHQRPWPETTPAPSPSLRGRENPSTAPSRSPVFLRLGAHRARRQDLLRALRSQRLFHSSESLGP